MPKPRKIPTTRSRTTSSDHCKFCFAYMDPIGCDTKKDVRGGTWCGQCGEGRKALYGAWSAWEIKSLRDLVKKRYEVEPIDWSPPVRGAKPESRKQFLARHASHLYKLWLHDLYQTLDRVLEDRKR